MIYLIISLIIDLIVSNIFTTSYQDLNLFFPMLFISSITISYLVSKNKKIYLLLLILIGLIYDLLFSSIFLINTIYFVLYYLFLNIFYTRRNPSYINIIIISFLGIVLYDFYIFLNLNLLGYSTLVIEDFYYKILNSILINIIYIILSLFILKSRIFGLKKKKLFS